MKGNERVANRLVRLAWLLGFLVAMAAGLSAQLADAGEDPIPPVNWIITVDEAGTARLEIPGFPVARGGASTEGKERLRDWAEGVLGAGERAIRLERPEYGFGWAAVDAGAGRRDGWQLRGRLDLDALRSACREGGWPGAWVRLELPRMAVSGCDAPGATREMDGARLIYSFPVTLESGGPAAVAWRSGYDPWGLAWRLGLAVLAALLPAGMVLWIRRRTLRLAARDAAAAWFGYWQTRQWLILGSWLLWGWWILSARWPVLIRFLTGNAGPAPLLILVLPVVASGLAGALLSRRVLCQLRGIEFSAAETVVQECWRQASVLFPVAFLLLGLDQLTAGFGTTLAFFGAALALGLTGRVGWVRSLGLTPHQLMGGELRERVMELARQAGVKIRTLFLMPAARLQMGNAFAMVGNSVILTDYLLERLDRREVDAVLAHEIGHLKLRHHLILMGTLVGTCLVVSMTLLSLSAPLMWILGLAAGEVSGNATGILEGIRNLLPDLVFPLTLGAGLAAHLLVSRQCERAADRFAVDLTGDPAGLITALVRISRMNLLPLQWGRWKESLITHPSTLRRVRAIAARRGLTPEQVEDLLQAGAGPVSPGGYGVPADLRDPERVFTTGFRSRQSLRNLFVTLALVIGLPLLWVALVRWIPGDFPTVRITLGLAAFLVLPGLYVAITDFTALLGYAGLRRRLGEKLARAGFGDALATGWWAGLSPDPRPRIYEGHVVWDVGRLVPGRDALAYIGDQASCCWPRDAVVAIERAKRFPGLRWMPAIRLRWRDESGVEHSVRLQAQEGCCVFRLALRTRGLARELASWARPQTDRSLWPPLPPALAALPLPELPVITGDTPRQALRPNAVVFGLTLIVLLTAGLGSVAGFGALAILYSLTVSAWTYLLGLAPLVLYRDPPS